MTCANASIFDLIDDIRKLNYQSELAIGRALDAAQSQTAEQSATITRLKEEIADFQSTFDLRWKADMRAIERWQKETGRKMVWPDHTDLLVWLMGKLEDKGGL